LKSAVEAGEAVPADLKARDQKTIDDAAAAINDAIAGLVAKETKSIISSVAYTPSESETNTFALTVNGRAAKVRFIGPDGGTMTFDRYSSKVVIKSYTAEGEECSDVSKDLAYEVWEITDKVADGTDIKAVAKIGSEWETESYNFTVNTAAPEKDYTVYSAELASTEGTDNKVTATVKTGLDVTKIRFTMKDGGSVTLDAANYATEVEGQLVFTYDVYTGFAGENTIKVDVKAGSTWVDGTTLTYNHAEAVAE
ncbi:MAG: hypothetical protein IJT03_04030, partial [Clostridia bacterium]|nr:hypothetical protein [Clostridia bacterium]